MTLTEARKRSARICRENSRTSGGMCVVAGEPALYFADSSWDRVVAIASRRASRSGTTTEFYRWHGRGWWEHVTTIGAPMNDGMRAQIAKREAIARRERASEGLTALDANVRTS